MVNTVYQVLGLLLVLSLNTTKGKESNLTQELSCPIWKAPADNCTVADYCTMKVDFSCFLWEQTRGVCIQAGTCITYDSVNRVTYGFCPYFPPDNHNITMCRQSNHYWIPSDISLSELNSVICGPYNREGVLCSKCRPGYGPSVYALSLMCVKCSDSIREWALYFFLALFPVTVFYLVVIVFNIQATSPSLTVFILFCQTYCTVDRVSIPYTAHMARCSKAHKVILQVVRVLCGVWNLDFFRYLIPPFCLSSSKIHLNNIQALNMDYIVAFYPLVLILCTYICIELHAKNFKPLIVLWRPFHKYMARFRRSWDPRASLINSFSTFLFISYSKITFTAGNSFLSTEVYRDLKNHSGSLYYEPDEQFFNSWYHVYFIVNALITGIFVFAPVVLLFLYPTKIFRRLLRFVLPSRWLFGLNTFTETIQGHYKDGTRGNRDYRSLSGLHLLILIAIIFLCLTVQNRLQYLHFMQAMLVTHSLLFAIVRPYKKKKSNIIHSLLTAFTALMLFVIDPFMIYHRRTPIIESILLLGLLFPHIAMGTYVIYKALRSLGCSRECCSTSVHRVRAGICLIASAEEQIAEVNEQTLLIN